MTWSVRILDRRSAMNFIGNNGEKCANGIGSLGSTAEYRDDAEDEHLSLNKPVGGNTDSQWATLDEAARNSGINPSLRQRRSLAEPYPLRLQLIPTAFVIQVAQDWISGTRRILHHSIYHQ
jgi:hypothetical protein